MEQEDRLRSQLRGEAKSKMQKDKERKGDDGKSVRGSMMGGRMNSRTSVNNSESKYNFTKQSQGDDG